MCGLGCDVCGIHIISLAVRSLRPPILVRSSMAWPKFVQLVNTTVLLLMLSLPDGKKGS